MYIVSNIRTLCKIILCERESQDLVIHLEVRSQAILLESVVIHEGVCRWEILYNLRRCVILKQRLQVLN